MVIKYIRKMADIEKVKKYDVNVVSTFSGAGGSCLGYRIAGLKVLWANEFIPAARETYKANHPSSILCEDDVRKVKGSDILKAIGRDTIDILDGSPPCAAFSQASGKPNSSWGKVKNYSDTKQRVDDLFDEYMRLIKELNPKVFIAENVSGLAKGRAKGYFNHILNSMRSLGYSVKAFQLSACSYGVPQTRVRIFFIGYRNDTRLTPTPPQHNKFVSLITDFPELDNIISIMKPGKPHNWVNNRRPYPTVTTMLPQIDINAYLSANGFIKDKEGTIRKLTIDEGKVICSFPLDFKLTGTINKQWERIGRSVPPILMANIADNIRRNIFGNT